MKILNVNFFPIKIMKNMPFLFLYFLCVTDDALGRTIKNTPEKNTKIVQGNSGTSQSGLITVNKSGEIVIKINAKPGAKNNNITGIRSGGIGIQIKAPPTDGKANTELIKYLSKVLGLRKSDLTLARGSRSKNKTIIIHETSLGIEGVTRKINREINKNH